MAYKKYSDLATDRLKIDMNDVIADLDPNANPFLQLTKKISKKPATQHKFEWMENSLDTWWDTLAGAHTADAGTLNVSHKEYFHKYDLVLVPETGVYYIVDQAPSGTGAGTISVVTLSANDADATSGENVRIVGNAYEMGSDPATSRYVSATTQYNYIQIQKNAFELSDSVIQSDLYGGDDLKYQTKIFGIEHARQIESALWFGQRKELTTANQGNLGGSDTLYTTGGVLGQWLTTSSNAAVTNANGTLTEAAFLAWLRDVFAYDSDKPRYIFCSALVAEAISGWAAGKLKMVPKDKSYGIKIDRYECAHGEIYIINNRRIFEAGAAANKTDYAGYAVALELGSITYRYLQGKDTYLQTNIQTPGAQRRKDEYVTYFGLEFHNVEKHGLLYGVTGWS